MSRPTGTFDSPPWQSATRVLALTAALAACDGRPGVADRAPAAPTVNDPAFSVDAPGWSLIGNALTPGQDELAIAVRAPDGVETIDAFVADLPGVRLAARDGGFAGVVDLGALPAGEHDLILAADAADVGFARLAVRRSHPLYVVVTNDWDDPDNTDAVLGLQDELHALHPELVLTHFVGPYSFTDPAVSDERRAQLVAWLIDLRDRLGDEIGLHIHPYCSFVEAAGVACRTAPSTVYPVEDLTGYTTLLNAYEPEELGALFAEADALFAAHGLGKPTSFRAGGWIADLRVLNALAAAGFVADTSANNWARLEEWEGVQNGVLYDWNKTNWSSIGDTSQPYLPSVDDILVPGDDHAGILEVPDNGILVDYVTRDEMIAIFDANFDGTPLVDGPRAYSIGYHPSNFNGVYQDRIHFTLLHVEQALASARRGPVVYARLSDLATVWTP